MNHRKVLDGMFAACGVPQDKFREICSAVDKLDKVKGLMVASRANSLPPVCVCVCVCVMFQMEWEEVRKEMVVEKGLAGDVADKIGGYVKLQGSMDLVEKLSTDRALMDVKDAQAGLQEMKVLLRYCQLYGVLDNVREWYPWDMYVLLIW